ncbi:MAG TPA: leucine-rich repeat protein [Candidatus Eubacterium faecigallinarum]|nr:leucine-rich repeat protein [Candidatus Eubacterium faecigallinarum]
MKKIISLLLGICVFTCLLTGINTVSFAAAQTEDIGKTQLGNTDTYYMYDADSSTLTVGGTGATPDYKNDNVSQPWYLWRGTIQHVIVEEGVTQLGNYFFYNVRAKDFSLPSTLVSIGNYSLSQINSATQIELPQGLVSIGDHAFYFSVALKNVNIPSSVTKIGMSAFENCTSLESVNIPASVAEIGSSAFENCSSLENVSFEDLYSSVYINKKAFFKCSSLKDVTLPKRAQMLSYSFGFYDDSRGSVYSDFVMNIYRDSPAYTYATNNIVNYNIINEMVMKAGQSIDCTYYTDSFNDEMIFIFTPEISDCYSFFSTGSVDVKCTFDGEVYDDNSLDDLNFTVSSYFEAGNTYYFTVNCVSQMSTGDFTVSLETEHLYTKTVVEPTLTQGGYTIYTCSHCGYSFETDFTDRTGVLVTGRVLLMESPDGAHPSNIPVQSAVFSVGEQNITMTDENGEFEFYVEPGDEKLRLYTEFSVDRTFDITADSNMEMNLGDICLINFDYINDGYINAKDFASLKKRFGQYPDDEKELYAAFDCNADGVIDTDDFEYLSNFLICDKLDESIYD